MDLVNSYDYYYYSTGDYFEFNFTIIVSGVCSAETVQKLATRECQISLETQPRYIFYTINILMAGMCTPEEIPTPLYLEGLGSGISRNETRSRITPINVIYEFLASLPDSSVAPVGSVSDSGETYFTDLKLGKQVLMTIKLKSKCQLQFNKNPLLDNSRHRYPWLCSLRSKDPLLQYRHYCAVNLLSRPPGPAVLVGPAHCTYLCKSGNRVVDNCCCAGPNLCSEDITR